MKRYDETDVTQAKANHDLAVKILSLLKDSFAYMDGRIDPPSSLHKLTTSCVIEHIENEAVLTIQTGQTPIACCFLTQQPDALYIGKLAVAASHRNTGAGKALLVKSEAMARGLGLAKLRLQTRIELTQNHEIFAAYGFVKTAEGTHQGFSRPTEITMEKQI